MSTLGIQVAYREDTHLYARQLHQLLCLFDQFCMTSLEAAKVTTPNLPRVDEFGNLVGGQYELPEKLSPMYVYKVIGQDQAHTEVAFN